MDVYLSESSVDRMVLGNNMINYTQKSARNQRKLTIFNPGVLLDFFKDGVFDVDEDDAPAFGNCGVVDGGTYTRTY